MVLNKEGFDNHRPILLAVNHPNSALDAIVLACVLGRPLHFLARGDAFKHPLANWFLRKLNMLPVYRFSEGFENLEKNNGTFESCYEAFKHNSVILIFPEGSHSHEPFIRPLKKGAVKLALQSCVNGVRDLLILPVGINYTKLTQSGGELFINIGQSINVADYQAIYQDNKPKAVLKLNQQLFAGMKDVFFEDITKVPRYRPEDGLYSEGRLLPSSLNQILAFIGWILNYIPNYFSKKISYKIVKMPEFMATVRFVSLFVFGGIYYLILLILVTVYHSFLAGILLVFCCLLGGYFLSRESSFGR
jgi:1-acyl-sn-glycerol-3-phosphate acyltransferase